MINVFYSHPTGFRFDLSESEYKQIENEIYKSPIFWIKMSWLIAQKVLRLYINCFGFALFSFLILNYNTSKTIDFHHIIVNTNFYFQLTLIPFIFFIWWKSNEYYTVKNQILLDIVKQKYPEKLENLKPVLLSPKDLYDPHYVSFTYNFDNKKFPKDVEFLKDIKSL